MKNKYIISLFFALSLFVGCYEDKGNYDYKKIGKIIISDMEIEAGWTSSFKDTAVIVPKITFEDGSTDESHLKYSWYIDSGGKILKRDGWDQRNFYWIADTVFTPGVINSIRFVVLDTRTGIEYSPDRSPSISIDEEFKVGSGVVILSEKDNNSQLSFLSFDLKIDYVKKRSKVNGVNIYQNVYQDRQGEVLGQGPISIHEHYIRNGGSARNSQYLILQQSGPVDIIGGTLTKDIDMRSAFVGGTYPPSVTSFVQASFMTYADVLIDQDGRLYSRLKLAQDLFQSSYFFPEPLKYNNKIVDNCRLFVSPALSLPLTLLEDKTNKRFLAVFDGNPINWQDPPQALAGKIVAVPGKPVTGDIPIDFIPLDNFGDYELVDGGFTRNSSRKMDYNMVFKNSSDEYFIQSFTLAVAYSTEVIKITNPKIVKIDLPGVPSVIYSTTYSDASVDEILFAVGPDIYRFDKRNPSRGIQKHLTFDSNIISINAECYMNYWGVVALENGKIHLINVSDMKNLNDDEKIIYSSPDDVDFGRIVDAKLRTGGNGW